MGTFVGFLAVVLEIFELLRASLAIFLCHLYAWKQYCHVIQSLDCLNMTSPLVFLSGFHFPLPTASRGLIAFLDISTMRGFCQTLLPQSHARIFICIDKAIT